MFNIQNIIAKKRDNQVLTKEEIEFFVDSYTNDKIKDYQAAALVMAIYINGLDEEETTNLTLAMADSGEKLDLSELGIVVDKHSTGGVGDKVTLVLAPIIASFGIPVAKMSGRGLGHTGGTIDKLESIPGYNVDITIDEFKQSIKDIGIALIGQSEKLAPADKKIYALRDSISATENIGLIASSIMSKKIAAGADKILLDVTYGNGAFMKTKMKAKELATCMENIGKLCNKETLCVITPMEQPLGRNIGNSLEVVEAIQFLQGNMEDDLKEVVLELGSNMMVLSGYNNDISKNKESILENINNGKALNKFKEWISNQGGDISYIDDITKFEKAKFVVPVISQKAGIITELKAMEIGKISVELGAGRLNKEDSINNSVGIVLEKKINDIVRVNEVLAYIHAETKEDATKYSENLKEIYVIK